MRLPALSPEQRARIPEFVDKWIAIGLSTHPLDHDRAEAALHRLYAASGLLAPAIVWTPCPLTAILSAIVYTKIRAGNRERRAEKALARIIDRYIRPVLATVAMPSVHQAIERGIEQAVTAALGHAHRLWTGFDAVRAIQDLRRASLDRVLSRAVEENVCRRLQTLLVEPVRAGLAPLNGTLQPVLSRAARSLNAFNIQQAGLAYAGAPLWAPYIARLDYAREVLGIAFDSIFVEAIQQCGLVWMLDGLCFAAERPTYLTRDEMGQLHCEVGPALAYASGWRWWHWHGVPVPQTVIEEPERITVEAIRAVREPPLRRVMIERYCSGEETHGVAAYLRDGAALRLDQDPRFGTLWRLSVAGEPVLIAEVQNHSPDPDGSYRRFFLPIHPELRPMLPDGSYGAPQSRTAHNAVASTFGLTGAEYMPAIET